MNGFFWAKAVAGVLAGAALLFGCKPQIGDDCKNSTNCSAVGDRLCDVTQPDGYCTMFNCEPGTCPDEAACIGYGALQSSAPGCGDKQNGQRLLRTFCLRSCDSNGDCRSGYECRDMRKQNDWGAVVIENGGKSGKVCVVPRKTQQPSYPEGQACTGTWQDSGVTTREAGLADSGNGTADAGDAGSDAPDSSPDGDASVDASGD